MILIISNKSDIHCNPVIKKLSDWGESFFRLNTEDLLSNYGVNFQYSVGSDEPSLNIVNRVNGKCLDFNEIKSVWERRPLNLDRDRLVNIDALVAEVLYEESRELSWWLRSYCQTHRYIGHFYLDRAYENKLLQLKLAAVIAADIQGIYVPDTFLTNNPDDLLSFYQNKNTEFITVKPIGSDSLEIDANVEMPFMSKKISIEDLRSQSQSIKICPVLTQRYIDKVSELRVTVIDTQAFTTEIFSQSLPSGYGKEDWREGYALGSLPQAIIDTPDHIVDFCVRYLQRTGLNFGCFDFIRDTNGGYAFLECNPNGQWMWMEEELGIPISNSIAKYLACK